MPGGSLGVTGVTLGVEIWLLPICWTHIQGEIHGVIMDVYDSSYFIAMFLLVEFCLVSIQVLLG